MAKLVFDSPPHPGPDHNKPAPKLKEKPPPRADSISLFEKATPSGWKLKALLYGGPGTQKTRTALGLVQHGGGVVIDMEDGTQLYADEFSFGVLKTTDLDEVNRAIKELSTTAHTYEWLVIDSFSVFWEALIDRFAFGVTDLTPKHWADIKRELKKTFRKILSLDMHVIVTCRTKPLYSDAGFMQVLGETFDGEKGLPYWFDLVCALQVDSEDKFTCRIVKDRTGKLKKKTFETAPKTFLDAFFGGK